MDIVINRRDAFYCNLKAVLIFLVIYGHLIEGSIQDSGFLMWQYRIIYSVHMPLFALLSGMFLKEKGACIAQMKNALKYYVILQGLFFGMSFVVRGLDVALHVPFWHLWYLLSLGMWAGICWCIRSLTDKIEVSAHISKWKRAFALIVPIISILLACAAGYWDFVGRPFSLSRTIVLLPYVLLGYFLPKDMEFGRHRRWLVMVGILALAVHWGISSWILGKWYLLCQLWRACFSFCCIVYVVGELSCAG